MASADEVLAYTDFSRLPLRALEAALGRLGLPRAPRSSCPRPSPIPATSTSSRACPTTTSSAAKDGIGAYLRRPALHQGPGRDRDLPARLRDHERDHRRARGALALALDPERGRSCPPHREVGARRALRGPGLRDPRRGPEPQLGHPRLPLLRRGPLRLGRPVHPRLRREARRLRHRRHDDLRGAGGSRARPSACSSSCERPTTRL